MAQARNSPRKPAGSSGREAVGHALAQKAVAARFAKIGAKSGAQVRLDHVAPAGHAFVVAAVLARIFERRAEARVWILTAGLREQENLSSDLLTWWGTTVFFPEQEQDRTIDGVPDQDVQAERLAILQRLASGAGPEVLVLNVASLEESVPRPQTLQRQHVEFSVGQSLELEELAATLEKAGFDREPQVAERGQFAIRGGIVDIYSWHADLPVRIELFDREVESIRSFDPDAQTSVARLTSAAVLLSPEDVLGTTAPLAECIGPDDLVIAVGIVDCPRASVLVTEEAAPLRPGTAENFDIACHENPLGGFHAGDFVLQEARREAFVRQLQNWHEDGWRVEMYFNNEGEIERFRELINVNDGHLACRLGSIHHGFTLPSARLAILSDAEVFGRYQTTRARRIFAQERRIRARRAPLDLSEMRLGDLVVHLEFGVAKYRGLIKKSGHDGLEEDVLVLEFQDDAKLYVPLAQAHLVSRYAGVGKKVAELSKLGDGKWAKTKKAAEKSIYDYAAQLLKIQAERQTGKGFAHEPDTKWQWEFENSFIYKETPDQLRAIEEAKRDMEGERPMDRLICGDVGFGKTEVAIRAAFKTVMSGKQVAVLCPTTVLAQQHHKTLRERMSDYPIRVESLTRFRTPREAREVIQGLAAGNVDVVVGTHRLISKDVSYKDLGLVVIDEEQRFGVLHKEKFKELFRLVDVLTLSATPIPRTLYLSLMGARDMSTIDTPPPNRYPVETTILAYDERVIRKAIERELKRGGQVYFLHNRVGSIERVAERIRDLCPGARVEAGHGQMHEGELEDVMQRFIAGEADVLVATTIIESGIDIPNANTIIIDRADRFGLADLYQLRGRVGRGGHKAYAYLMLPQHLLTTGDARKRINAIKQYTSLGSGFKIAMRDLEIRGAGNLLGTQQSGHVVAIGFDLYCQVLRQAVSSLRGQPGHRRTEVALDIDFLAGTEAEFQQHPERLPAFIPAAYMEEAPLRIAAYKQAAEVSNQRELEELTRNWRDRFGPLPPSVENLLQTVGIRLAAANSGIGTLEVRDLKLMLQRRGEFILLKGKFPRLREKSSPKEQLGEILVWLRKL